MEVRQEARWGSGERVQEVGEPGGPRKVSCLAGLSEGGWMKLRGPRDGWPVDGWNPVVMEGRGCTSGARWGCARACAMVLSAVLHSSSAALLLLVTGAACVTCSLAQRSGLWFHSEAPGVEEEQEASWRGRGAACLLPPCRAWHRGSWVS